MEPYSNKDVFIFDVDGTLTEKRATLQKDMAETLCKLLEKGNKVVIISGGNFEQLKEQFLSNFYYAHDFFRHLYLLPTYGTRLYSWNMSEKVWYEEYAIYIEEKGRKIILDAFEKVLQEVSFSESDITHKVQVYDKGTEVSFCALGLDATAEERQAWDSNREKKLELIEKLKKYIPEFGVAISGSASVDVTKKENDKEYGVNKFLRHTGYNRKCCIFFGDTLFEGGNDFPVTRVGIDTVSVLGPKELQVKLMSYI